MTRQKYRKVLCQKGNFWTSNEALRQFNAHNTIKTYRNLNNKPKQET